LAKIFGFSAVIGVAAVPLAEDDPPKELFLLPIGCEAVVEIVLIEPVLPRVWMVGEVVFEVFVRPKMCFFK
jgi:hypothetical protein